MTAHEAAQALSAFVTESALIDLESEFPGILAYANDRRTTVLDTVGTSVLPAWYVKAQENMCFDASDIAYLP